MKYIFFGNKTTQGGQDGDNPIQALPIPRSHDYHQVQVFLIIYLRRQLSLISPLPKPGPLENSSIRAKRIPRISGDLANRKCLSFEGLFREKWLFRQHGRKLQKYVS